MLPVPSNFNITETVGIGSDLALVKHLPEIADSFCGKAAKNITECCGERTYEMTSKKYGGADSPPKPKPGETILPLLELVQDDNGKMTVKI